MSHDFTIFLIRIAITFLTCKWGKFFVICTHLVFNYEYNILEYFDLSTINWIYFLNFKLFLRIKRFIQEFKLLIMSYLKLKKVWLYVLEK